MNAFEWKYLERICDVEEVLENTMDINDVIFQLGGRRFFPADNHSIIIETKQREMKLVRLTDPQYLALFEGSLYIDFDDYSLTLGLMDDEIVTHSLSKTLFILEHIFGDRSEAHDEFKSSFAFRFMLTFVDEPDHLGYLLAISDLKGGINCRLRKIVSESENYDREKPYKPFSDFPEDEILYCLRYFFGYLTGRFKVTNEKHEVDFFFNHIGHQILYGYKEGEFFDHFYENWEEYESALQSLKEYRKELGEKRSLENQKTKRFISRST